MSKYVAFIPVRGGSKGIPCKNIKLLNGKPLLQYVIDAAVAVEEIDNVVIATDSDEIRNVVQSLFGEIDKVSIFDRDPVTATDEASTESAMLDFAARFDQPFENIILIQATSPLLKPNQLKEGIKKYEIENLGGLVSVVEQKRFIWQDNTPVNYSPENRSRRQNFKGHFIENGAFYITSRKLLLENKCRISEPYGTYTMPLESYYEIDEPEDWTIIENILAEKETISISDTLPKLLKAVVFDFDGVFTDNKVIVQQNGDEAVICDRGDGMGISMLKKHGIDVWVLSKEQNPVLKSRCEKLKIPCIHGVDDKWPLLKKQLKDRGYSTDEVIYVGNDVNDIECIQGVKCGVAVADSHPEVLKHAGLVLSKNGGSGAIRELSDMLIQRYINE